MILRYAQNLIRNEIKFNSIHKQNFSRIRILVELYLSKSIDEDLLHLAVDYSYYDIHLFEGLTEDQIFKRIWKDSEHYLSSHNLEIIVSNIIYDRHCDNNIDKDKYKYTQIMNLLVEYHKWLSNEYSKNKIIRKSEIEHYLLTVFSKSSI